MEEYKQFRATEKEVSDGLFDTNHELLWTPPQHHPMHHAYIAIGEAMIGHFVCYTSAEKTHAIIQVFSMLLEVEVNEISM